MSLAFTKKHKDRVAEALDAEHESLDDAVAAVLVLIDELIAERASFVVVGQLIATKERSSVPASDPEAIKLALGFYSTEGDARAASDSLWHSTGSGDTFRRWVLPMFHGTPAELHKERRDKYAAEELKRKDSQSERMAKQIAQRSAESQRFADEIRAREAAADQHWPCPSTRIKANQCRHEPKCK